MSGAEMTWIMQNAGLIGVILALAVMVSLSAFLTAIMLAAIGE